MSIVMWDVPYIVNGQYVGDWWVEFKPDGFSTSDIIILRPIVVEPEQYEVRRWSNGGLIGELLAGPFDSLDAAKAAYLLML